MTNEPYKTPQADLLAGSDEASGQLYVVSRTKMAILFMATFGLYTVYWFYQNWRNHKDFYGTKIWPVPRSIFFIFFTHSLFGKVDALLREKQPEFEWSPNLLATLFVIVSIISNVLDRLSYREIGSPLTDILSLLILPVALIILLKAQDAINLSQDDRDGESNRRLTLYNYIWIVLGGIFWIFVAIGLLAIAGVISIEGF